MNERTARHCKKEENIRLLAATHGYPEHPGHTISTASTPSCTVSSRVAPIRSAGFSPLGGQALGKRVFHKADPAPNSMTVTITAVTRLDSRMECVFKRPVLTRPTAYLRQASQPSTLRLREACLDLSPSYRRPIACPERCVTFPSPAKTMSVPSLWFRHHAIKGSPFSFLLSRCRRSGAQDTLYWSQRSCLCHAMVPA